MMPAGRNRCDNGVSTEAAAGGTWLRIRNRDASPLVVPALTNSAEAPKSTTPRPARSPAVHAVGSRGGWFGHHHDAGEIMESKQSAHRPGGPDATGWPLDEPKGLARIRKPQPPPPGTSLPLAAHGSGLAIPKAARAQVQEIRTERKAGVAPVPMGWAQGVTTSLRGGPVLRSTRCG